MNSMNSLDYVIVGIVALSAIVGLLRGFVRETISLLAWIGAFWLSMTYSYRVAAHLGGLITNPTVRLAAAFIALFLGVLIVGMIINYLLARLLKKAGVGTSDRILGVLFGTARGVLVVALVVVLVELTPLEASPSWRGSVIVGYMHPMVNHLHSYLPGGPRGKGRMIQASSDIGR